MANLIAKVILLFVGLILLAHAESDLDLDSDSLSGALVGGLPDDDMPDSFDDDDGLDKALDSASSFHRFAIRKHSKQSVGDDDEDKDEDDADDEQTLAQARAQKLHAETELKSFEDDTFFDKGLAADVAKISNETQSPALAEFLGELKENQRKYARPEYIKFLKKQVKKAEKTIKKVDGDSDDGDKKEDDDDDDDDEKKKKGKKEKKEKKKKDDEQSVLPLHQSAGETFAVAFFANVAMIALVFAMANAKNQTVSDYTWFLLDQVVCIFLAVMHFQAFDSLLDVSAMGVGNAVVASVVHTLFLLAVVLGVAYYFTKRGNAVAVAVICGAGAHFVSFASIHTSASMQNKVFVSASYTVTMCALGLLVLGVGIAIIAYIIYSTKARVGAINSDSYMDKSDDVENDAGATAFSVVFTMMMRFILTGHHPVDDDTDFDHTSGQRVMMLIYAFICLIVAGVGINVIGRLEPKDDSQYAKKRVCNFFKAVLAMDTAWAFLYWGEWEFFEALYPNDPTKGRVMFAVVSTMIGGALLLALTRVPDGNGSDKVKVRAKTLALTALGLVIAFSWELTFDSAMEQMVEGTSHPVYLKVLSCVAMLAIILPVYALYMKPIVDSHSIGG